MSAKVVRQAARGPPALPLVLRRASSSAARPPFPPFTRETAQQKVLAAEAGWNTRDPAKVALAYTPDSRWRNRDTFLQGREAIEQFLKSKWEKEREYALRKELFAFEGNRIAVRFQYEYEREDGKVFRAYGNEHWTFDASGLMERREASINDYEIQRSERRILGPRNEEELGQELPL